MTRIPKYRAFNNTTKEMLPVLLICFVNQYVDVLPERNLEGGEQEAWFFQDIKLLEYTGLKDIKDEEIYVGDIIGPKHEPYIIVFLDGMYVAVPCGESPSQDNALRIDWIIKNYNSGIIGNIYE